MWLTFLNILLAVLLFAGTLCQFFLKSGVKQLAKNTADILQNREKAYEAEKGRNLATREDIEEITAKIESVKNELSLSSKWAEDHIREREKHLVNILYGTEKLLSSFDHIKLLSSNTLNANALREYNSKLQMMYLDYKHDINLLYIDGYVDMSVVDLLGSYMVDYITDLTELVERVAMLQDAANAIDVTNKDMILMFPGDLEKYDYLKTQIADIIELGVDSRKSVEDELIEYKDWLKQLYENNDLIIHEKTPSHPFLHS